MILAYALLGAAAVLLVLLLRSTKAISAVSILHALACLSISIYVLLQDKLPQYFMKDQYFFIDHLNIYAVLISSLVFVFAGLYATGYEAGSLARQGQLNWKNFKLFNVAFNLLLTSTTFAFFSNNLALFWIFAELTTVFSVILIAARNVKENLDAAIKYIFVASASMLFTFIGIILLFALSSQALGEGTLNWNLLMQNAPLLHATLAAVSFGFIFIGFAAKSGIVPFHTWLPHAHSRAPSAISAILSGVVLNIGIYGILRVYAVVRQTTAVTIVSNLLIFFGVLSIGIAALSMLQQKDLKKLIAFSSVENMGLMLLSISLGTPIAIFWLLFYMLGHSLAKALLFFSAGILHKQYESNAAADMANAFKLQPLASWGLIIGGAAVIGMPPFLLFASKFFILLELQKISPLLAALVLLLLLIAGVASILLLSRIFTNTTEKGSIPQLQIPLRMKIPIVAIITLAIALGIFIPSPLQHALSAMVSALGGW